MFHVNGLAIPPPVMTLPHEAGVGGMQDPGHCSSTCPTVAEKGTVWEEAEGMSEPS